MNNPVHAETAECSLLVTAALIEAKTLRLTYRVTNYSALPVYLCNLFWEHSQVDPITRQEVFEINPNAAHVHVAPDGVSVRLALLDLPLSVGAKIFYIPCLTRLAPTEHYTAQLELPLPLVPYGQSKTLPASATQQLPLRMELGYFIGKESTNPYIDAVATSNGAAYTIAPFMASEQVVLITEVFEMPVAVWERTVTDLPF